MAQIDSAAILGKLLQIYYSNGVINQISEECKDWEAVTKVRVSDAAARSINFMLQTGYGPRAVGYTGQGSNAGFKNPQRSQTNEYSAGFNNVTSTIELEYDLWQRAMGTPSKYAEPLALEVSNKAIAQKRMLSRDFHGDGSGLLGITSEQVAPGPVVPEAEKVTLPDSSFVARISFADGSSRNFEYQDAIVFCSSDGSVDPLGAAVLYGIVDSKDRAGDTVDFKLYKTGDVELSSGEYDTAVAALLAGSSTRYCYRENQDTRPDLSSGIVGEVNDLSEVIPGLESLFAEDGRIMHGISMRGANAGTQYDAGGNLIDISILDNAISQLKVVVGSKYKYNQLLASPEARSVLIDSQEQDRRLQAISDNKRGFKAFGYVHDNDVLELTTSEWVKRGAMWVMPQGGKEKGCIELHGKDFNPVNVGGTDTFLNSASGGGHTPDVRKYMMGWMTLLSKHPAATLKIKNFSE